MEREAWPADASSLIYVAKADGFELIRRCVGVLSIPPSVWREAVDDGDRIGAAEVPRIRKAASKGSVKRMGLTRSELKVAEALRLDERLGKGESEVLVLAMRNGPCVVDEGRASRVAQAMGLRPIPTLLLPVLGIRRDAIGLDEAKALMRRLAIAAGATAEVLAAAEEALIGGGR